MSSCEALVNFINNTKRGQTHTNKITDTTTAKMHKISGTRAILKVRFYCIVYRLQQWLSNHFKTFSSILIRCLGEPNRFPPVLRWFCFEQEHFLLCFFILHNIKVINVLQLQQT